MKHVVDSVNKFCSTDNYLLCTDSKVYWDIPCFPHSYTGCRSVSVGAIWTLCMDSAEVSMAVCFPIGHVHAAGAPIPNLMRHTTLVSTGKLKMSLHKWILRGTSCWTTIRMCCGGREMMSLLCLCPRVHCCAIAISMWRVRVVFDTHPTRQCVNEKHPNLGTFRAAL